MRGGRKTVGGSGGWKRLRYLALPADVSYTSDRARSPDASPPRGSGALAASSPRRFSHSPSTDPTAGAGRTKTYHEEPELYGPCTAAACPPSRAAASASPPTFLSSRVPYGFLSAAHYTTSELPSASHIAICDVPRKDRFGGRALGGA